MTLIELLVALTIFGLVISASLGFMAQQNAAFQEATRRLVALRNLRYAAATMGQDLETLGTNVPGAQPAFYYGDEDVVVFSADYATNIANDPFAVFYDPDAPSGQVRAPSGSFSIPNSAVAFADTVYESAPGVPSPAEVIAFYVTPDTSTTRSDDYVLYRKVNAYPAESVARNLLRQGTLPFFSYQRLADNGSGTIILTQVPDSLIPIHHSAKIHLSPADTGRSARADSVRAIELRFRATNGLTGAEEETVELTRLVGLPNAGFGQLSTCGSAPILGVGLGAGLIFLGTGEPAVRLTWSPAVDESGGENDVVRYVIFRRIVGAPTWGDPYVAIPGGAPNYTYQDASVAPATAYQYALAAQDCTPTLSPLSSAALVVIP
jgi:type II secretory pathway pseudopilin PulG